MDGIIVLLVIIGGAFWLFRGKSAKPVLPALQVKPITPSEEAIVEKQPQKSPEEKLAECLKAAREAISEKTKLENRDLQEKLIDAKQKLKAANELSKKLGLSEAITNLAEEMDHWHAWSKNTNYNFSKNLVDGLVYIGGENTRTDRGYETTINTFVFNNAKYRLSVANEHWGYESTDKYGEIIIEKFNNGSFQTEFKAEVIQDGSRDFAPWRVLNVTDINLGDWAHDMTILDALILARKEKERLERDLEYVGPKTKNLMG